MSEHHVSPRRAAQSARAEEKSLRDRWEVRHAAVRERLDAPISAATKLTRKTLALFPVRVKSSP
ncbi:hypothetical protein [Microbacterium lacticum]